MLELFLTVLLLLPSVLIARRSVSGSNAGYYILYIWLAESAIYGFFGLLHFLFGLLIVVSLGYICREKLAMHKWWSDKSNGKEK